MSLASRLADLIAAVGADVKALNERVIGGRKNVQFATGSLALNASENVNFDVNPSWRSWKINTSRAARVRVYASDAYRTADASRAIGTDPTGDHGLLFEFVTGSTLTFLLSPVVDFMSGDGGNTYYAAVTNLGTTGVVTTTLYYVRTTE